MRSPQVSLEKQVDDYSFSLQAGQHRGLDHLPSLDRTLPHPGLHQLQGGQFLIHGCRQLQDLQYFPGMPSYIHTDVDCRNEEKQPDVHAVTSIKTHNTYMK